MILHVSDFLAKMSYVSAQSLHAERFINCSISVSVTVVVPIISYGYFFAATFHSEVALLDTNLLTWMMLELPELAILAELDGPLLRLA